MAPRKSTAGLDKPKDVLTAVVMADSFTQRFRPATMDLPKVQLPLVNASMVDYTLEWLATSGVQETWVFCCAHAAKIKRHLADAKWIRPGEQPDRSATGDERGMKVHVMVSTNCMSLGEALRRLDQEDVVKADFVLVSGDCVSNMDLSKAVDRHKERREKNKNAIMTMVFHQASSLLVRERLGEHQCVVTMDGKDGRLLRYDELDRGKLRTNSVAVDAHFFSERDDLEVRCDLVDTNIYICAPEVLMLFSDNFDYQNLRRDFVSGVLSEEELGNQLYVHELKGAEYAAWVGTMRSYDAVSRDVLQRWAWPFGPDSNTVPTADGRSSFLPFRGGMTREMVRARRQTEHYAGSCIGDGTRIGDGASVSHSVIGRNCTIGAGAVLEHSYVLDGVHVGDGAVLRYCLVCSDCRIGAGAVVQPGCIVSFGAKIAPGHTVPPDTKVSVHVQQRAEGDFSDDDVEYSGADTGDFGENDDKEVGGTWRRASVEAADQEGPAGPGGAAGAYDEEAVGPSGVGYRWQLEGKADDGAHTGIGMPPHRGAAIYEEMAEAEQPCAAGADADRPDTAGSDELRRRPVADDNLATASDSKFREEVEETLLRAAAEDISIDNLGVEINSLKIAEDRDFSACSENLLLVLLDLCLPAPSRVKDDWQRLYPQTDVDVGTAAGKLELLKRLKAQLERWGGLLTRFVSDEDDQVNLLLSLEDYCSEADSYNVGRGGKFAAVFKQVFQLLYDLDVVGEEAFLQWAAEKQHAEKEERVLLELAQPFIDWLNEAEEDSDDEEEEEEEEEDSE